MKTDQPTAAQLQQMNPYRNVRNHFPPDARAGLIAAFRKSLSTLYKPRDPFVVEHHTIEIPTPHGNLLCMAVARQFDDGTTTAEVTMRVLRPASQPGQGPVFTPPTWFELNVVRALAWPDDADVHVLLGGIAGLGILDPEAVHMRGPVTS